MWGESDVRQFFPLAHLAPIFTQPMGGSSTHVCTVPLVCKNERKSVHHPYSVHHPLGSRRRELSCSDRPQTLIVGLQCPLRKMSVTCPQPRTYNVFKL